MDKRIERIITDAIENAWEEAKLRDLMTLYLMWKEGFFPQFSNFDEFFLTFYRIDDKIREMDEKEYITIESKVVEIICNSSDGIPPGLCGSKKRKDSPPK